MRIVTARQHHMCNPAFIRVAAPAKFPDIPSKGLDALGISQQKLNGNFMSWMDSLTDRDKEEGGLWYPTGNDWGHHAAQEHDRHPDKVFGAMSKYSPQRDWYANLQDAHNISAMHGRGDVPRPGGISATDNHRQAMRVFDAEDHPDAIDAAFLGTKNVKRGGQTVAVPRTPRDIPKTHDFYTALRDPEAGGAFNHAAQPAVADSWMSRSGLWSKDEWDEAKAGGKPLEWPGQGTGEGLDKHMPIKKPNPATGKWEVVGTKAPNARDVAGRVMTMGGAYDRMRQMMQFGAQQHNMPFAHGAQAAVWKQISGNRNPNEAGFDHSKIGPPGQLWNQMWNQRASGLLTPQNPGFQVARRTAAHGSRQDIHGPEMPPEVGWGTPQDYAAMLKHVSQAPPGWDHWSGRPGRPNLYTVDVPSELYGGGDPHQARVAAAHMSAYESPPPHEWPRDGGFPSDARCPDCGHRGGDHAPGCPSTHWSNVGFENDPSIQRYRVQGAFYDPFEFADAQGPHDNPWSGSEAEQLRKPCPHCHAPAGEPCDPHCPTNHTDDPWRDTRALGGPPLTVPDDTMHRLNSVDSLLAHVDGLINGDGR